MKTLSLRSTCSAARTKFGVTLALSNSNAPSNPPVHRYGHKSVTNSNGDDIDLTGLELCELRSMLKQRGLPTTGKKKDLIKRLLHNAHKHDSTNAVPTATVSTSEQTSGPSNAEHSFDSFSSSSEITSTTSMSTATAEIGNSESSQVTTLSSPPLMAGKITHRPLKSCLKNTQPHTSMSTF